MTNRERALAWMKEECSAADGPRFHAAGEEDVPGEPHCDCLESLAKLLDVIESEARERGRVAGVVAADGTSCCGTFAATGAHWRGCPEAK